MGAGTLPLLHFAEEGVQFLGVHGPADARLNGNKQPVLEE
jgi:hypothetical protein